MQYNKNAKLDSSQMGSGGGRGGVVALGGGAGIIVMILALVFGFDPGAIMGSTTGAPSGENEYAACKTGADIEANRECRYVAYTNSIQDYWSKAFSGYEMTKTQIFTGSIPTGCGTATSAVGPFYCPADKTVYLDTGFFDQMLEGRLGAAGGDAAEAYVIAHEYGHHISNLTGVLAQVQSAGQQTGPTSPQVRLELQADCYAGVWLANATNDPESPIAAITQDDLNRAVDAAIAVGDDRIQEATTGRVDRESWTHGSSAQRKRWMAIGFNSGDPNQCDTFAVGALD